MKRFPCGIYISLPITMLCHAFTQPVLMFVDGQVIHGYIAVAMFSLALIVFTLGVYEASEVIEVVNER